MRTKLITTLIVLLLFPLSAESQQRSLMAIHCDDVRAYVATCEIPEGYAAKVDIYIWMYHPSWDLMGAIFSLDYPDIVQPEDTFYVNESIVLGYIGDLANGIEVGTECISGWNWIIRQTMWITTNDQATIDIIPHSNPIFNGEVLYVPCFGGEYEFEYTYRFELNVNPDYNPCWEPTDLIVGVESVTWGAVKSLYR